ncbi:hypothetical protein ACOME3_002749 [Neoechinorhynchus agilis]
MVPQFTSWYNSGQFPDTKNQCFVIVFAHPDDECMFFAPTIFSLRSQGHSVYLLSLSAGNYNTDERIRRMEIIKATQALNIIDIVENVTTQANCPNVITFDSYGISGHVNHRSIGRTYFPFHSGITVYRLRSVSLWRKYLSLFELPFNALYKGYKAVCPLSFSLNAMRKYKSQLKWFRVLYMLLSRYACMNELVVD